MDTKTNPSWIQKLNQLWLRIPPAWRWCLGWFLALRIGLSLWGALIWSMDLIPPGPNIDFDFYFGLEPIRQGWQGAWLGVWQRWDTIHYLRLVEYGYFPGEVSAFFPLYPLLSRGLSQFFGLNGLFVLMLVSNVTFLLALVQFYHLVEERFGNRIARYSVGAAVLFPGSLFFFAGYAEPLALLLVLLAIRTARQGRWLACASAGFAAGLTLPTTLLMTPALAWLAWKQRRDGSWFAGLARLAAAATPALGIVLFLSWRELQGYMPYSQLQYEWWGWHYVNPVESIKLLPLLIPSTFFLQIGWANVVAVILVLAAIVWGYKALSTESYLYTLGLTGLLLLMRKDEEPFSSWARHAIMVYPLFIALGVWFQKLNHKWIRILVFATTLSMLLYVAGYYIMWGWTG
ncbi:MAG: mannosyltransferase family protein [Anaerolineales bacterium]|jgi:hypothetical protein